jgi:hypothetical protein
MLLKRAFRILGFCGNFAENLLRECGKIASCGARKDPAFRI